MSKILAWFIISIAFSCHLAFAQQDSLLVDTIIIVKDPHIINKQVYTYDAGSVEKDTIFKWNAEIFYLSGKSTLNSASPFQTFSEGKVTNYGIFVSRNIGKFEIGTGLNILNNCFSYTFEKTEFKTSFRDSSYDYVLDSYISRSNGEDSIIYITEPRDTTLTSQFSSVFSTNGKNNYSYLQIPISLGYKINFGKTNLFILPRVQLTWASLLKHTTNQMTPPKQYIWNYGVQLNVGYTIFNRISILAKAQWNKSLTSVYNKEAISQEEGVLSYGLGLSFIF